MKKHALRAVFLSLVLATTLVALGCAPAAPAPAPKPAPAAPKAPETPAKPAAPTPAAAAKKMVEAATPWGPAAATATAQNIVLSKLLKDHSTWLRSSPMIVAGFAKGVEFWEKGRDTGVYVLVYPLSMMAEYTQGVRSFKAQGPRKDQGLLWVQSVLDNYWVSREGSKYKTMNDLKGARIGIREPGSSTLLQSMHVLEYGLGLKPEDYKATNASVGDLIALMREGSLDVVSSGHVGSKGLTYPYLEDLANSVKLQYLSSNQAMVDKINKALGAETYALHTLPAGMYRNQTTDVNWVGSTVFVTFPTMYSADIAYELCRVWFDYFDEALEMNSQAGHANPDLVKAALKKKWPFDWHPGALKYFKEKGWA